MEDRKEYSVILHAELLAYAFRRFLVSILHRHTRRTSNAVQQAALMSKECHTINDAGVPPLPQTELIAAGILSLRSL